MKWYKIQRKILKPHTFEIKSNIITAQTRLSIEMKIQRKPLERLLGIGSQYFLLASDWKERQGLSNQKIINFCNELEQLEHCNELEQLEHRPVIASVYWRLGSLSSWLSIEQEIFTDQKKALVYE